jgi:hypothetical protein
MPTNKKRYNQDKSARHGSTDKYQLRERSRQVFSQDAGCNILNYRPLQHTTHATVALCIYSPLS